MLRYGIGIAVRGEALLLTIMISIGDMTGIPMPIMRGILAIAILISVEPFFHISLGIDIIHRRRLVAVVMMRIMVSVVRVGGMVRLGTYDEAVLIGVARVKNACIMHGVSWLAWRMNAIGRRTVQGVVISGRAMIPLVPETHFMAGHRLSKAEALFIAGFFESATIFYNSYASIDRLAEELIVRMAGYGKM